MKMLFKQLLAATMCISLVSLTRAGGTAEEIFNLHRQEILSEQASAYDGFYFARATTAPKTQSANSMQAASSRARLQAYAQLVDLKVAEKIGWPKALSAQSRLALSRAIIARQGNTTAAQKECLTLYLKETRKEVSIVVAIAKENLLIKDTIVPLTVQSLLSNEMLLSPGAPVAALVELQQCATKELPPAIDLKPWQNYLSQAAFTETALRKLPQFAGRFMTASVDPTNEPNYVEAMAAYAGNEQEKAFGMFKQSLTQAYSFEALNMAGNVARRLKAYNQAVALLIQAAYIKPSSPYPWVHLAYVAQECGDLQALKQVLNTLKKMKLDPWSQEKYGILCKMLESHPHLTLSSEKKTHEPVIIKPKMLNKNPSKESDKSDASQPDLMDNANDHESLLIDGL